MEKTKKIVYVLVICLALTGCGGVAQLYDDGADIALERFENTKRSHCRAQTVGAMIDFHKTPEELQTYHKNCGHWIEMGPDGKLVE